MKISLLLAVICLVGICSCSKEEVVESEFGGRTFVYLFFSTEQECLDAQPDPDDFINCHQELRFINHKKAELTLTDIIDVIEYQVVGRQIIISSKDAVDFSEDIVFNIIDSQTLQQVDDESIWKEVTGESIWE